MKMAFLNEQYRCFQLANNFTRSIEYNKTIQWSNDGRKKHKHAIFRGAILLMLLFRTT